MHAAHFHVLFTTEAHCKQTGKPHFVQNSSEISTYRGGSEFLVAVGEYATVAAECPVGFDSVEGFAADSLVPFDALETVAAEYSVAFDFV